MAIPARRLLRPSGARNDRHDRDRFACAYDDVGESMSQLPPTITLTIDGRTVSVPKGTTVYNAARRSGIEIPIFCYHDRMPPLGACRMCLVKVEKMPKLQTSCTLEVTEGMTVFTTTPEVKAGQEAILEFLLINHPLDCPMPAARPGLSVRPRPQPLRRDQTRLRQAGLPGPRAGARSGTVHPVLAVRAVRRADRRRRRVERF